MSIAFNKRDYRNYDSEDDDSLSDEDSADGGEGGNSQRRATVKAPLDWVDELYMDLKDKTDERAAFVFDRLESHHLAEFLCEFMPPSSVYSFH